MVVVDVCRLWRLYGGTHATMHTNNTLKHTTHTFEDLEDERNVVGVAGKGFELGNHLDRNVLVRVELRDEKLVLAEVVPAGGLACLTSTWRALFNMNSSSKCIRIVIKGHQVSIKCIS